jgi:hypothetical protein
MLRTIFLVGFFTVLGIFALRLAFGIFGLAFGILAFLLGLAIKIAIIGVIVYLIIRIVSPDTARKIRSRYDT